MAIPYCIPPHPLRYLLLAALSNLTLANWSDFCRLTGHFASAKETHHTDDSAIR